MIQSKRCPVGITCLSILCKYYGRQIDLMSSSHPCENSMEKSLPQISEEAEKLGFHSIIGYLSLDKLSKVTLPCLLCWNHDSYVILQRVKRGTYYVVDPLKGLMKYSEAELKSHWIDANAGCGEKGFAIFLKPTGEFYRQGTQQHQLLKGCALWRFLRCIISWNKRFL